MSPDDGLGDVIPFLVVANVLRRCRDGPWSISAVHVVDGHSASALCVNIDGSTIPCLFSPLSIGDFAVDQDCVRVEMDGDQFPSLGRTMPHSASEAPSRLSFGSIAKGPQSGQHQARLGQCYFWSDDDGEGISVPWDLRASFSVEAPRRRFT